MGDLGESGTTTMASRMLLDDDFYGHDDLCMTLAYWGYVLLGLTLLQILIVYCIVTPGIRGLRFGQIRSGAYLMAFLGLLKVVGGVALAVISQQKECTFQTFYGVLCVFLGALWMLRARRFINLIALLHATGPAPGAIGYV